MVKILIYPLLLICSIWSRSYEDIPEHQSHQVGMQKVIIYRVAPFGGEGEASHRELTQEEFLKMKQCGDDLDTTFREISYFRTGLDITIVPYFFNLPKQSSVVDEVNAASEAAGKIDEKYKHDEYDYAIFDKGNGGAGKALPSTKYLTAAVCGGSVLHEMMHAYGLGHTRRGTTISNPVMVHKLMLRWVTQDNEAGFGYLLPEQTGTYRIFSDEDLRPAPEGYRTIIMPKQNQYLDAYHVLTLKKSRTGVNVDTILGFRPLGVHGSMDLGEGDYGGLMEGESFVGDNGWKFTVVKLGRDLPGLPNYADVKVEVPKATKLDLSEPALTPSVQYFNRWMGFKKSQSHLPILDISGKARIDINP